ncbi:MAG TPA: RNA polymerase sigma factor [Trebonia sp.]|nr:RNA polymerase sigma factor [Trebonia sp.]
MLTADQATAQNTANLTAAVEGARQGDAESFRVLYRDTQPRLLRYLAYLVDSDAEDIASETWLQATRDLHTFHGNYENFRGWITTIARHRAMDHLRHRGRQPPAIPVPVEDLTVFAGPDDTASRAIEAITTDGALRLIATLPRDQAEAVLLRAVVGLDAKSTANLTGKRAGAVRTAAYRGLRTLAKRLAAGPDSVSDPDIIPGPGTVAGSVPVPVPGEDPAALPAAREAQPTPAYECMPVMNTCTTRMLNVRLAKPSS